jgi:hypothetical protein
LTSGNILGGTFFGLIALGIAAMVADSGAAPLRGRPNLFGLLCGATVVGLIAWVILAVVLQLTAIRVKEITDWSITLAGVSEEFVAAYEADMPQPAPRLPRGAGEYWDEHRRHPPAGGDDAYRPRGGAARRPPDEFQEGPEGP